MLIQDLDSRGNVRASAKAGSEFRGEGLLLSGGSAGEDAMTKASRGSCMMSTK